MEDSLSLKNLAVLLYIRGLVPEDAPHAEIMLTASKANDCLEKLCDMLEMLPDDETEEAVQSVFYEAGKLHFADRLRYWFRIVYQIVFGQDDGPRLGQFAGLVGKYWIVNKIRSQTINPWNQTIPFAPHDA
jgi:lysyl-tRNA synthetase class 1